MNIYLAFALTILNLITLFLVLRLQRQVLCLVRDVLNLYDELVKLKGPKYKITTNTIQHLD